MEDDKRIEENNLLAIEGKTYQVVRITPQYLLDEMRRKCYHEILLHDVKSNKLEPDKVLELFDKEEIYLADIENKGKFTQIGNKRKIDFKDIVKI